MYADLKQTTANHLQKVQAESLPYPVDMAPFVDLERISPDAQGVVSCIRAGLTVYDPAIIARAALVYWNRFCTTQEEHHRQAFLTQARWLVAQQQSTGLSAGGWVSSRVPAGLRRTAVVHVSRLPRRAMPFPCSHGPIN